MNTIDLRELLSKATPRPWSIYPGNNLGGDDSAGEYQQLIRNNKIHCPSDAALIVALVNNAEALRDEVDAWRQVWTALNEMGANLGDANKPLSVAASWALKHYEKELLLKVLKDWQEFAADVRASDAAGQDWLDGLKARTARIVDPCS